MARKREAFGLSLLDVLSNALVGAIVLMLIASVFTKVLNDLQDSDEQEQGESEIRTSTLFPTRDKINSEDVLNIALKFKSGPGIKQDYELYIEKDEGIANAAWDSCVTCMRGAYDDSKSYWLVSRTCPWKQGETWRVKLRSSATDLSRLPDSVEVLFNLGVNPVGVWNEKVNWNMKEVDLIKVTESAAQPTFSTER